MAIKLDATANDIELKKNRIQDLENVNSHDEGYPTALAAKQYADSLKVTVDTELSDKSDNPLQNKVITKELKKLKELGETQSDWNTNDNTSPSYIKNRPFYTDKVESDVWEFAVPITNEATGEGIYCSIPMPDADLSQFTDGQELEYEVYDSRELQSSGTNVFFKSVNIREMFEDEYTTVDADVPNELMGMGEDAENVGIIFGITLEITDVEQGIGVVHNTPNACFVIGPGYGGNEKYAAQVKFKNFKNIVDHVNQIPSKYINWDDYVNYVNNKKWKWEYRTSAMPFDTQPTIITGNVNKLKADTFYFIKYTDTAETKFKLTYGADILVDDTLEFNRNDAWNSSSNYKFIHCISVDTANNKAIFGKPYPDDELISCIIPNNTKNLRMKMSARAVNMDIKNSPNPVHESSTWGSGFIISADDNPITGNNYETIGCGTQTVFNKSDNSLVAKEVIVRGEAVGLLLSSGSTPACVIDPTTENEPAQIKHPRYEGLLQNDVFITVADDRRSYNMEGTSTGVCWEPINSVTFTNSFDLSSIKATYPTQCYSQLQSTDKKLFFKTNEANNKRTQLLISTGDAMLTGFSITVEGEIE